jgi:hypothetical protein
MGIARTGVTTSAAASRKTLPSAITLGRVVVWSERRNGYGSCHGRGSLVSGAEFVCSAFDFSDMLPSGPSVKAGRHRRTAGWAYRADRVAGSRLLTAH